LELKKACDGSPYIAATGTENAYVGADEDSNSEDN